MEVKKICEKKAVATKALLTDLIPTRKFLYRPLPDYPPRHVVFQPHREFDNPLRLYVGFKMQLEGPLQRHLDALEYLLLT